MEPVVQTLTPPYLFLSILELVFPLHCRVKPCLRKPRLNLEQAKAHPEAPTAGWLRKVPFTVPFPKVAQGGEQEAQQLFGQGLLPGHVPKSLAHMLEGLAVPEQQLLAVLHVLLPLGLREQLCQTCQVSAQHKPLELRIRASVEIRKHLRVCTTSNSIPFSHYHSLRK